MATSGQLKEQYSPTGYSEMYAVLSWQRISFSEENNTSTISWEFRMESTEASKFGVSNESYTVTFGAKQYSGESGISTSNHVRIIASGTETLTHNIDGTLTFNYGFTLTTRNWGVLGWGSRSASGTGTLDTIIRRATITDATVAFTDEQNPTITYSNPAGNSVTSLAVCIADSPLGSDNASAIIPYREVSKTGTSYTFELTDAERILLRKHITSGYSATVRYYIRTVIGGNTYYHYIGRTFYLVNYTPTLSPVIEDTNTRTLSLTGDKNKLIKYYSNAKVTFGAAARKEATLVDRRVICGSQTIEIEDRAQDTVTINGVDSNTFYLRARDSRGYSVEQAPTRTLINYIKLTNSIKTSELSSTGELTFTISGKYFNGSFGAKNNSLEVEYLVIDENGDPVFNTSGSGWVQLGTVTPTVDNGNYTYSYTITGLNYLGTYTLTVNAIDELTPVQTSTTVVAAIPVFDWGKDDFHHHTNVHFSKPLYGVKSGDSSDVIQVLDPCNSNNNLVIGYGNYAAEEQSTDGGLAGTNIYGNIIRLYSKNGININNVPLDYIVEQGSSGTWFYRKWNQGRVELYGYQNISDAVCNTAMGNMYRTAVITPPSFPFTVNSAKLVSSYESEGYGAFIWHTTLTTTAKPPNYYLVRPTSSTGITGKVNFHVQGTWK